jgi:hypothetical protein
VKVAYDRKVFQLAYFHQPAVYPAACDAFSLPLPLQRGCRPPYFLHKVRRIDP